LTLGLAKSFPACSLCARKNNAVIWYHFFLEIPKTQPNLHATNVQFEKVAIFFSASCEKCERCNGQFIPESINCYPSIEKCMSKGAFHLLRAWGIRYIIYCNLFSKIQDTHMVCILRGM
jgi:hypothetical protein